MNSIENTLEKLVTAGNSTGSPIITGYNYHPVCLSVKQATIITFSNIQSHPEYYKKVLLDLGQIGFPNKDVTISKRVKKGFSNGYLNSTYVIKMVN